MKLCDYGCGREAKHYFPTVKKWCCEEECKRCPVVRKRMGKRHKKPIFIKNSKYICDYGCGQIANYQFQNGKRCCQNHIMSCPSHIKQKIGKIYQHPTVIEKIDSLCSYGCGRPGKYLFKNGSVCCQKNANKCPTNRSNISESHKGKEGYWKDKTHTDEYKDSMRISTSGPKNGMYGKKQSDITKKRISIKNNMTIEQIYERYPTFTKEEEIRYNPDKPLEEKEIQVHCKYNKCPNSKEKGGWFTPLKGQLSQRFFALEHKSGTGGCFLYCSERCKRKCCLFNIISDPFRLTEYEQYNTKVWKITHKTVKNFSHKIKNINLRGYKYGYDLDHKYTIHDGFENNIDPKILGHYKNLEILTMTENREKNSKSSITINDLLEQIEIEDKNNHV